MNPYRSPHPNALRLVATIGLVAGLYATTVRAEEPGHGAHASLERGSPSVDNPFAVDRSSRATVAVDGPAAPLSPSPLAPWNPGAGRLAPAPVTKTVTKTVTEAVTKAAGTTVTVNDDDVVRVKPDEPLVWKVNPVLLDEKGRPSLPTLGNGFARTVASVRYRDRVAHFAENELLLTGADEHETGRLAARVGGKTLGTFTLNAPGKEATAHVRHVVVEPSTKTSLRLVERLDGRADTVARGLYEFSSHASMNAAALALLAIEDLGRDGAFGERAGVGLNWIMPPTTLENEVMIEGVNATETGFLNAFRFPYLNAGSAQNTQVNHAWQLLKIAGVLDGDNRAIDAHRVDVTVMDGGFHSAVDLDDPVINGAAFDQPNPSPCSAGNPCPWHGSMVAEVLAAPLNNARATAGPAGPVADMTLQTSAGYDVLSLVHYVDGLRRTLESRPRVVNMSFGSRVPALFRLTTLPLDVATTALYSGGATIVAAAGNDGESVDTRLCNFGFVTYCRELDRSVPCELAYVVCVGSLNDDSVGRATHSAFGHRTLRDGNDSDTVDLYAQGVDVFVGPTPATGLGGNGLGTRQDGTSLAAPLVAGMAALVVAANPEASPATVNRYLLQHASTNARDLPAGAVADGSVVRWANAARPVRQALRDANPDRDFGPQLTIVTPTPPLLGTVAPVAANEPVTLVVNALDVEDGIDCCRISWRIDGVLLQGRTGSRITHVFSEPGRRHEIEVSMRDSGGQTAVDTLTVMTRR